MDTSPNKAFGDVLATVAQAGDRDANASRKARAEGRDASVESAAQDQAAVEGADAAADADDLVKRESAAEMEDEEPLVVAATDDDRSGQGDLHEDDAVFKSQNDSVELSLFRHAGSSRRGSDRPSQTTAEQGFFRSLSHETDDRDPRSHPRVEGISWTTPPAHGPGDPVLKMPLSGKIESPALAKGLADSWGRSARSFRHASHEFLPGQVFRPDTAEEQGRVLASDRGLPTGEQIGGRAGQTISDGRANPLTPDGQSIRPTGDRETDPTVFFRPAGTGSIEPAEWTQLTRRAEERSAPVWRIPEGLAEPSTTVSREHVSTMRDTVPGIWRAENDQGRSMAASGDRSSSELNDRGGLGEPTTSVVPNSGEPRTSSPSLLPGSQSPGAPFSSGARPVATETMKAGATEFKEVRHVLETHSAPKVAQVWAESQTPQRAGVADSAPLTERRPAKSQSVNPKQSDTAEKLGETVAQQRDRLELVVRGPTSGEAFRSPAPTAPFEQPADARSLAASAKVPRTEPGIVENSPFASGRTADLPDGTVAMRQERTSHDAPATPVQQPAPAVGLNGMAAVFRPDGRGGEAAVDMVAPVTSEARMSAAPPPQQQASTPPQSNPPQVMQVSSAILGSREGSFEIHLQPAELGKVRISLMPSDAGIVVSVLADRPETLDLLRRHVDQLAQDFREIGYESASFSFGAEGQGDSSDGRGSNLPGAQAETTLEPDEQPMAPAEASPVVGSDGRMDLRV